MFSDWINVSGGTSYPVNGRVEIGFQYQYEQDLVNNTTTLRLKHTVKKVGTCSAFNWNQSTSYFKVDGVQYNKITRIDCSEMSLNTLYPLTTSGDVFVTTEGIPYVEMTIPHNADGTKSISIYEYIACASASSVFQYGTFSTTLTLPTINRVSLSDNVIGSSTVITVPMADDDDNVSIDYTFGSQTGTLTFTGQTYNWVIPNTFAQQIPTSTTGTLELVVEVGLNTYTSEITLEVNETQPTLTSASLTTSPINGSLVVGYTTLTVVIKAPSINNYANCYPYIKCNGVEYIGTSVTTTAGTSLSINNVSGNGLIEYGVIDGRGFKTTQSTQLTVIPYQSVIIGSAEGEWDTDTNTCDVVVRGSVYSGASNTLSVSVNGTSQSVSIVGSGYVNFETTITISGDPSTSLTISCIATDAYSSFTFNTVVPKATPLLTWGEDYFNVNGEIRQNGSPIGSATPTRLTNDVQVNGNSTITITNNIEQYTFYNFIINVGSHYTTVFLPTAYITTTSREYYAFDGSSSNAGNIILRSGNSLTFKRNGGTKCYVTVFAW